MAEPISLSRQVVSIISDHWLGGIEPAQARQQVLNRLEVDVRLEGVIRIYERLTDAADLRTTRMLMTAGALRATRRG